MCCYHIIISNDDKNDKQNVTDYHSKQMGIRCHQKAAQAASRSSDIFNLGMMLLKDSKAMSTYGCLMDTLFPVHHDKTVRRFGETF